MSETNGLHPGAQPATERSTTTALQVRDEDRGDVLWDPAVFAHGQRLAQMFAASSLVPDHLRGKVPDVLIALSIARRVGEDPLTVMQNMHVVKGKPGWTAKYLIARASRHGIHIRWRIERRPHRLRIDGNRTMPDLTVTAWAKLPGEDEPVEYEVTSQQAIDAGWAKNDQYTHSAELMLRYRSATQLLGFYSPAIMLGLPTTDEAEDITRDVTVDEPVTLIPATPRRGLDAIDAVLADPSTPDPAGPPQPTPSASAPSPSHPSPGAEGTATEAAPPRRAHDPAEDGRALVDALREHRAPAQLETTAKDLFRKVSGQQRVNTERYHDAIRWAEAQGLVTRSNGSLVVVRAATTQPPESEEAPIPTSTMVAINEWEQSLGLGVAADVARSVGIPTPGDVPDLTEVGPEQAQRYLAALKVEGGTP